MKNVHYVIDGVLAVAVIILFVLFLSGNRNVNKTSKAESPAANEFTSSLPVAYIDADLLIEKYFFSIDLNEQITKKNENTRAYLAQQQRNLQTAIESF